ADECARLIGEPSVTRRTEALFQESGGNPLYALALHRLRAEVGDRSEPSALDGFAFGHFEALILGETMGLSRDERAVLRTCSVLGTVVSFELLARILTDLDQQLIDLDWPLIDLDLKFTDLDRSLVDLDQNLIDLDRIQTDVDRKLTDFDRD